MRIKEKLLKNRTKAEMFLGKLLWAKESWKFEEQRRINTFGRTFYMDFYFPHYKFGIELEGGIHQKQIEYDSKRENLIKSSQMKGIDKRGRKSELYYDLIRLDNDIVLKYPNEVMGLIKNIIIARIEKIKRFGTQRDNFVYRWAMDYESTKNFHSSRPLNLCHNRNFLIKTKYYLPELDINSGIILKDFQFSH